MICVSIGRSRHKHMLAEFAHLVEQGAELVELRLDYISTRVNIQRLLKDRPCATVVTVRREQDGGKYTGSEESRLIMLREAIANGVEYIDLEDDIADKIPRFGKTKRIISYHSFRNTPENLRELHNRLKSLDADIVKIATMANQPHDNLRVLEMVQQSDCDTVGMCMGDIGSSSRILGAKFGAKLTYATFHHERTAPGQLSYDQMVNVYRHNSIGPETAVYGVIADPVGHSLSPQIHNAEFGPTEIDAVYVPFRVPFDTLGQFMEDAPRLGIRGLSVTIPHKEAVAKFLTKVDPAVKGIGAVNTVLFRDDGVLGYNTDYKAAMDCLETALGGVVPPGTPSPLADKRVLVLGAGGVARAIMYGLQRRGAKATIASRTKSRAQYLADTFGGKCVEWGARHAPTDILVNCTPIGMHPNVDESPFTKSHLKSNMVVFDTVYNPESTLLLKEAKAHGCKIVSGVEMFIKQAALQFFLFTGKEASEARMRDTLRRAIGPQKY